MCFPFRDIICYQENKVSIVFLASRKNYIHKLLPVDTASTMLLRLLSSFFMSVEYKKLEALLGGNVQSMMFRLS